MRLLILFFCFALPLQASSPELDELRIAVDDLKYALKSTQVELNILDERVKKQSSSKPKEDTSALSLLTSQVNSLEKKVANLEKTLEKAANDLRSLSSTATAALTKIQGMEQDLSSQEKRIDEVVKLKGTLASISKAISARPAPDSKSYRVKAGDSLEKIARANHVSVEAIKKINHLSNDKIVVGQELRLECDTE
jgi:LysM repeat protein